MRLTLHSPMSRRALGATAALLLGSGSVLAQIGPGPGPLPPPPVPPENPITMEKVQLGKALFWDEQLSSTNTTACGTCHIPARGGADPRSLLGDADALHPGPDGVLGTGDDVVGSPGVPLNEASGLYAESDFGFAPQVGRRQANSAIDAAYGTTLFWDGRASGAFTDPISGALLIPAGAALESQAAGPPVSAEEMGHVGRDWNDVAARIESATPLVLSPAVPAELAAFLAGRSYPDLFELAFGTPDVTPARIVMAIATYERTLVSTQTPLDVFLAGGPPLTPLENQGRNLFNTLTCGGCHGGALKSDNLFHYIGVRPQGEDLGRFEVTGLPGDRGAMRSPSLRNVELRGSYFHNGEFETLAEVVDFYDRGGDFNAPNKAPGLVPLGLSPGQKAALLAFLGRPLTDPRVAAETAPFDRPLLYTESERVPLHLGAGTAGAGGVVPEAVAYEPASLGNGSFTFGVSGGRGGAPAFLALDVTGSERGVSGAGITWHVGFSAAFSVLPVGALAGVGPGNGHLSLSIALPDDPALLDLQLFGQWVLVDPLAPTGRAAIEAFAFTIF